MAIIKSISPGKSLARIIDYVDKKAVERSGKDCSDDARESKEDMNAIKDSYGKTEGRLYSHVVQSFEIGEITPEQAIDIGREYADRVFKDHQVYIATHAQPGKPIHNHFVINSVSHVNGRKFQLGKPDLERLKRENDRLCKERELSIPVKGSAENLTNYNGNKYRLLNHIQNNDLKKDGQKHGSFVFDTAVAVNTTLKDKPCSREEFISAMEKKGYQVQWADNLKHITYIDAAGKKVRADNLVKTFERPEFIKENMDAAIIENARAVIKQQAKEEPQQRISTKEILWLRGFFKTDTAGQAPEGYIAKMEKAGFIKVDKRYQDESDWKVEITDTGKEAIKQAVREIQRER